jgi:hypothetical protein
VNNGPILLAIIAAGVAAQAAASTWVNVGKNASGSSYDVDLGTIERNGNLVTFTVRTQYAPAVAATGADGFVAIRQGDCADRTYTDIHTDYMKGGKVLNSTTQEDKLTARAGTIGASVLDKACSK